MRVTADSRTSDLVRQFPRASRAFEVLGIDYCHDDRSLAAACSAAGYDVAEIVAILDRAEPAPSKSARENWQEALFARITSHVVDVHHRHARRLLVDLLELIGRVITAHGAAHPELWQIRNALEDLARQLVPHMLKEERFLFPYINSMDQKMPDRTMIVPLYGTVEYPLQTIRHDHGEDLQIISMLRNVTHNFSPPEKACSAFRILYATLAEFVEGLEKHIHLENDVLFPRALEAERTAARAQ